MSDYIICKACKDVLMIDYMRRINQGTPLSYDESFYIARMEPYSS